MVKVCCSYPTYEEWKPASTPILFKTAIKRSYPTYEEWKRLLRYQKLTIKLVLILPMRNGNFDVRGSR